MHLPWNLPDWSWWKPWEWHWRKVVELLKSLPEWQKIVGAILFFLGLVVVAIRFLYAWVLVRLEEARTRVRALKQMKTAATSFQITQDEITAETGLPRWLVQRALRWQKRKKLLKA